MLHLLFDVFSLWFWLVLLVVFAAEIVVAENEATGWGFLWLAIGIGVLMAFSDFNPFAWIGAHWLLTPGLIVAYYVAGVLYAFFRWALLIRDPEEYRAKSGYGEKGKPLVLQPGWYRDRIVSWMMWWPPSLAWWLLRWPRKIFIQIYNALSATFSQMATSAAAKQEVSK